MKVKVDKDLCIGCGLCVSTCPEVFKMDGEGGDKAVVIVSVVPKDAEETCRRATEECPVTAIIIV